VYSWQKTQKNIDPRAARRQNLELRAIKYNPLEAESVLNICLSDRTQIMFCSYSAERSEAGYQSPSYLTSPAWNLVPWYRLAFFWRCPKMKGRYRGGWRSAQHGLTFRLWIINLYKRLSIFLIFRGGFLKLLFTFVRCCMATRSETISHHSRVLWPWPFHTDLLLFLNVSAIQM